MLCENSFCIYQKNGKCILEEININELGQCDECIKISINDTVLEKLKQTQLSKLEGLNMI